MERTSAMRFSLKASMTCAWRVHNPQSSKLRQDLKFRRRTTIVCSSTRDLLFIATATPIEPNRPAVSRRLQLLHSDCEHIRPLSYLSCTATHHTMPAATRSLESMVLQAHRAKGVRYPTSAQKDCFKTWYSYALRRGEVEKTSPTALREHGRQLREMREAAPGGRTYL
jgi:hypothetical protein